jgi:transposase
MPDALWERIAAVLATVDPTPPADARALLNAVIYMAVTDASWDELPAAYPPPTAVQAAVERWRSLDLFHHIARALHLQLDEQRPDS